jgi:hypothetical protein
MMYPMGFTPFFKGSERQYPAHISQSRVGLAGGKKRLMCTVMEKDKDPDQQAGGHNGQAQKDQV